MTADQATQDIIHLVYEAAVISPDPYVQETHVETSIRDVLEELLNSKTGGEEDLEVESRQLERQLEDSDAELQGVKEENETLHAKIKELEKDLDESDTTIKGLREKLRYTQDLLGEYVGK